ncbi:hypothetical protein NECAME_05577 [Necator americanus]|uniref:SXP/RAL-2 family protein Ani s 5-like cation-binding domain-containing protein n=1 Tax=Necator americanus TaxID=51031 RepID=W2SFU5_NECAM|nr:hypothetical protein NECAME_05577 [Necator americanus]ETN68494.1 hypothetical protein NECAME_05577 [Necator americanus]
MRTIITVIALIGVVLCDYRRWNDYERRGGPEKWGGSRGGCHGGRGRPLPPYLPPYLRNVTTDAVRKYFGIISETNLTLAEQKEKILAWGNESGILAQVEESNRNMSNLRNDILKNVTEFISKLSNLSQKFSEVMENENQTAAHLREAIVKLRGRGFEGHGVKGDLSGFGGFGEPKRENGFGQTRGETDFGGPRRYRRQGGFGGRGGIGGQGGFEGYGVTGDPCVSGEFGGPEPENGLGQPGDERDFRGPRGFRKRGRFGRRGGSAGHGVREDSSGFGGSGEFGGPGEDREGPESKEDLEDSDDQEEFKEVMEIPCECLDLDKKAPLNQFSRNLRRIRVMRREEGKDGKLSEQDNS